ncbi:pentatricopeptide repeat-containing protein At5g50280, chloroplastic [Elaeis guineensis]|uniref:pentatricopeptide repeat-containing protein At5g50280, chloroplastic n=1 Tax=Elaeis guineensis var. tenera TaxID=51953 RepID=UPI003C6D80C9
MALKTLGAFSFASPPTPCSKPSSFLPFPSSLRFRLRPPKTLIPPSSSAASSSVSSSPSPIFLPHLESPAPESLEDEVVVAEDAEEEEEEQFEKEFGELHGSKFESEEENGREEDYSDPILNFFKSRSETQDPKREGRLTLQRNRRSSWHIADFESDDLEEEEEEEDVQAVELDSDSGVPEPTSEDGVVGKIMGIARSLPENSTLGEFLDSFAGKVDEGECIELLRRMGEEGLVRESLYLYEWMGLQEPSLVTPRSCSVLFPILGRARMGDKLMVLFENLPRGKRFRDVCVYNAAISGLSCCGRYDDAWRVFEDLEANNIKPDHVTCSILITVMRKTGKHAKDAWDFFECMNRKGVKWNLEVFGALIKSFCDEGLKKESLIIQSEMEKKGISSNVIIYNTLMDAYVKSNQVEEAEGLFVEMKEKGLKPTTATYNILMDAYSRRMQPEIVEALLSEMQSLGLKPNIKSYTCLISAYGRQRKMSDMAADSFLRMKKAGIKPTSHSYTALIHAYSVGGWHEKAHAAYQNMKREGIKPSIETYTALLDAFRRASETEKLMEVWKEMINNQVEGTRVTFNILLDGLAKHGLYVQARDVIHEFGRIGLQPTVMTYNILMNAYARGGQHNKLPQLLKEMTALELNPDSVTYSTMIYAYVRVRDFTKAFYYHKQMVRSGQVPDARSYQKLRAILDAKAAIKNRRDRSAIFGIVNSKFGLKPKKGKKDELWKNKKKRWMTNRVIIDRK